MRRFRTLLTAAVVCAALSPTPAHPAGYSIYEQGAAALGMGGTGTAAVHDASALFFNPAAMTRLEGTRLYVGGSLLAPSTSFAGVSPYSGYGTTEEMKRQYFFPPTLYLTHRCKERWAVGAGINSPYGLGIEWKDPDAFSGRYIVTKGELQALNGNLSAAYAVNPRWSVAAGADLMMAKVKLHKHNPFPWGGGDPRDVAETDLKSGFTPGAGWNAAVSFAPNEKWKLGAFYRSKVVVKVDDGTATFTQRFTGDTIIDSVVTANLPPNQGVSTVLRFPAIWSAGIAYHPTPAWTLEGDFNFFEWSLFRDLPIRFHTTTSQSTTVLEDYDDSWQARFGAEHRLPNFTYRFGYYYDKAAAPTESVTPLLPDAGRHGVSLGFGRSFGTDNRWTVDAYELGLFVQDRSTDGVERDNYNGTYKSFVNIAGFSVAYRW
ncbi:MAG: outer membrane protein transport protein [Candidatus Eisenbacteria bacterium]|nr:outer membrane protein transport protein [Candidatus Eisenbacteria bacterium]